MNGNETTTDLPAGVGIYTSENYQAMRDAGISEEKIETIKEIERNADPVVLLETHGFDNSIREIAPVELSPPPTNQYTHSIPAGYTRTTKGSATAKRQCKKIGRNSPCPCSTGKKFKKCCKDLGTLIAKYNDLKKRTGNQTAGDE